MAQTRHRSFRWCGGTSRTALYAERILGRSWDDNAYSAGVDGVPVPPQYRQAFTDPATVNIIAPWNQEWLQGRSARRMPILFRALFAIGRSAERRLHTRYVPEPV